MTDSAQPDAVPDDNQRREPVEATGEAKPAVLPLARIDHISFDAQDDKFAKASPKPEPRTRDWRRIAAAASLTLVVAAGAAAAVGHFHALNAGGAEASALTQRLDVLSSRLEALEANRARDEGANLRKVLAEIKAGAASARDVGGAVGQLSARVDKLEKEQGARLDKLAERIDHDAAQRLADVNARLEKLEAKTAAQVATAPAKPSPELKSATKPESGVSNETTGAIAHAPPRLRGFYVADVRDGFAMIEGPGGEFVVAAGDSAPGLGRVLKIERRGRDWAVVTTQGQISSAED